LPSNQDMRELYSERGGYERRRAELTNHPHEGGRGLDASEPQVLSIR
jgi:hypothetical protein